jgi:hypothetical protein
MRTLRRRWSFLLSVNGRKKVSKLIARRCKVMRTAGKQGRVRGAPVVSGGHAGRDVLALIVSGEVRRREGKGRRGEEEREREKSAKSVTEEIAVAKNLAVVLGIRKSILGWIASTSSLFCLLFAWATPTVATQAKLDND